MKNTSKRSAWNCEILKHAQGKHTEYLIKVITPKLHSWTIKRRYREFREVYDKLRVSYMANPDCLPSFPQKRWFGNNDFEFIEKRQKELQTFLNQLLDLLVDPRNNSSIASFLELHRMVEDSDDLGTSQTDQIIESTLDCMIDLSRPPVTLDGSDAEAQLKQYINAASNYQSKNHVLLKGVPLDLISIKEAQIYPIFTNNKVENEDQIAVESQLLCNLLRIAAQSVKTVKKPQGADSIVQLFPETVKIIE
eukprot:GHVL01037793.1.p1 GENE.GHVL01037793.1~~GHVL01037793.1.p1  ORF type:complete len:259 (+),score=46.87 GHVL01037793.1:28-777(+)